MQRNLAPSAPRPTRTRPSLHTCQASPSAHLLLRDARVLLGGLGVGFSLDEAVRAPEVAEVVVVELEPAVVDWARTHLRSYGGAGLDDPRVTLVAADLADALETLHGPFDAVCLDV